MDVNVTCHCFGEPHGEDVITFREKFTDVQGFAIESAIGFIEETDPDIRPVIVMATLSHWYLLMGIESWTMTDEKGKPLPVTSATIAERVLAFEDVRGAVREPADALYGPQVLVPLVERALRSSRPLQTAPSTSPKPAGTTARRPKRSRQSLISTTPMDVTETISPLRDGAYSSSQNLALAD